VAGNVLNEFCGRLRARSNRHLPIPDILNCLLERFFEHPVNSEWRLVETRLANLDRLKRNIGVEGLVILAGLHQPVGVDPVETLRFRTVGCPEELAASGGNFICAFIDFDGLFGVRVTGGVCQKKSKKIQNGIDTPEGGG